ncbi:MAG: D-aminoacylase [Myxococcota bacterium]
MSRFLLALMVLITSGCASTKYDLILRNATIYDGSGDAPFVGDVAIAGDTIAAIGNLSSSQARNVLELKGLAMAPGFINMLSWANTSLIEDGRSQGDIRQGVTLEVLGEGLSMGPLTDSMKETMKKEQGDIKYDISWTTLGEYLQFLEDKGISTNVASFVGNGTLRRYVIGNDNRSATPQEVAQMKALLKQAMQEGAVGISSALLYAPSAYADTQELIELAQVAAHHNGMYISHIRSEGDELLEAIDEVITIARKAAIAAEIYHLKASGQGNWHKLDAAIVKIEKARADGLSITANMYPYPASSTGLDVQLPDWVREGGAEATVMRLHDPALRQRILNEVTFDSPPQSILLAGFRNKKLRKYTGKRLTEVATMVGKSPAETLIDLIVEDDSRIQAIYFSMSDDNIVKKLALPWISFCSDAASYTNEGIFIRQSTHPRAYGSFARVLGKYVRDERVITLQEAVRKLTALPADNLQIKKRGRLQVGHHADIVVFDAAKIQDVATFESPHQYSEGVVHVWVNGIQVLENGEHTGANAGRFVKGPGWTGPAPSGKKRQRGY